MQVPSWGVIPFGLLLTCIAVAPVLARTAERWKDLRFPLALSLVLGLPTSAWMCWWGHGFSVLRAMVEYGQFVAMFLSLFVVTGSVFVSGDIRATPRNNTLFLATGAACASLVGTMGAALLLVRPLLNTNRERAHKAHTFVFATFVVANTGGLLTPLGDPPLFLGFLRGVPFLWTTSLIGEWLFVNGLLLLTYYALDCGYYAREPAAARSLDDAAVTPLVLRGKRHLAALAGIVVSAALLPSVHLEEIHRGGDLWRWIPWREVAVLTLAWLSYRSSDRVVRYDQNRVTWHPMGEVAAVFLGIFLTMVPALKVVSRLAPRLPVDDVALFALTGGLSAVLDNAPTYAIFFEVAREQGGVNLVAGVHETHLTAISLGAVLCGAITYVGNGPNLMIKSITESSGVRMPAFGGYVLKWSLVHLVPVLVPMVLIFLVQNEVLKVLGLVMTLALVAANLLRVRAASHRSAPP